VFLVEGRQNGKKSKTRKEGGTFFLHSTKEWKDLWEIIVKGNKGQEMSDINRN
jgi:hypothetical protein